MTARSVGFFFSHDHPEPNITDYVPFCRPGLLLRDNKQRVKEMLNLRERVRGKRQREKRKLEGETEDLVVSCL